MYKTNYLMLIFIATLAIGVGYLACTLKQISYPELRVVKYEKKEKLEEINKTFFDKISLSYNKNLDLIQNQDSLILKQNFYEKKGLSKDVNALNFSISYLKDGNSAKLTLDNWFKENIPLNTKNQKKEKIKVDGVDGYVQNYYSRSMDLDGYFTPIVITIINNTDVYQIFGYQLPEIPDPALTPADIQAAHEYEAIFNQILQSIKFVD